MPSSIGNRNDPSALNLWSRSNPGDLRVTTFCIWILIILNLMLWGCHSGAPLPPSDQPSTILFMGHTYDHHGKGERVDPRLEALDYALFHRVILGGDVCSEAL